MCVCVYTKEQGIVLNLLSCTRVGTHMKGTICGLHRGGYGGSAEVAHARYPFLLRCQKPILECTCSDVRDGVGWKCSSCKTCQSVREGNFFCQVPADPTDLGDAAMFLVTPEPHV